MDVSPEPTPYWPPALRKWGALWHLHIFCLGAIFLAIGFWNIHTISLLLLRRRQSPSRTFKCFITTNTLLAYFNLTRGSCLLLDPYNSNVHNLSVSKGTAFFFWGLTVPCFTASFMLINMALLDVTKVQLYSSHLQNFKFISAVVLFHFLLVSTVDLVTIFFPTLYWLLYVCQVFFLLLGLAVAGAILYSGCKVLRRVKESKKKIESFNNVSYENKGNTDVESGRNKEERHIVSTADKAPMVSGSTGVSEGSKQGGKKKWSHFVRMHVFGKHSGQHNFAQATEKEDKAKPSEDICEIEDPKPSCNQLKVNHKAEKTRNNKTNAYARNKSNRSTMRLTIITMVIAVAAILYTLLQVYSLSKVFHVKDPTLPIDAWHWFVYQTLSRMLEIAMGSCMAYVVRAKDAVICCRRENKRTMGH